MTIMLSCPSFKDCITVKLGRVIKLHHLSTFYNTCLYPLSHIPIVMIIYRKASFVKSTHIHPYNIAILDFVAQS